MPSSPSPLLAVLAVAPSLIRDGLRAPSAFGLVGEATGRKEGARTFARQEL